MILVTGATGYAGRNLVSYLTQRGKRVRCLVRRGSPKLPLLEKMGAEICYGDVTSEASLREALRGVEKVAHLVAIIRQQGSQTFDNINHLGTRKVVAAARETGVEKFVHVSAIGAGNTPQFPYLYSKWQGEQEVINSGIPWVVLRPSFLFEEGEEFFASLACVIKALPVVPIVGSGKTLFQPIAISDLVRCVEMCLEEERLNNRVVTIGGAEQVTYAQVIELIMETLQTKRPKIRLPVWLMRPAVALMTWLLPHPPITSHELAMVALDNIAGLHSVEESFGFRPKSLRGNLYYLRKITYGEAIATVLGFKAWH